MIIFNSIVLLLIDLYIFKGLRATQLRFPKSRPFPFLWWGYSFLLIMSVFVSIYTNIPLIVRSVILVVFFSTFITKFIYILILLADDMRRGGVWVKRLLFPVRKKRLKQIRKYRKLRDEGKLVTSPVLLPENPVKGISRSDFLTRAGILVAAAPLVPISWGVLSGAYDYRVRREKLYLPNLPKAFDGMKIGQLSDIHSGSFYNQKAVRGGVELLLAEKPDVIFFTGDLVNNLASEMRDYQDIFSTVKAPLGVYSVLGNHDYGDYHFGQEASASKDKNLLDLIQTHKVMGWDLLQNENRILRVDNEEIAVLGVENWGTGRFPKHGNLQAALAGIEESPVKLLLSHDPSHWRAQILPDSDVDVTFSGHTHGMQFGIRGEHFKWSPVQYIYKEWAGLYREEKSQLYVNTGFGFLGYPGRVGIVPEITIFELIRGNQPGDLKS